MGSSHPVPIYNDPIIAARERWHQLGIGHCGLQGQSDLRIYGSTDILKESYLSISWDLMTGAWLKVSPGELGAIRVVWPSKPHRSPIEPSNDPGFTLVTVSTTLLSSGSDQFFFFSIVWHFSQWLSEPGSVKSMWSLGPWAMFHGV